MSARLLVFDRKWQCRWDHRYPSPSTNPSISAKTRPSQDEEESMQLIMGLCYSIRSMLNKLSHTNISSSNSGPPAYWFRTDRYRLHYYETFTGWKFVLLLPLVVPGPPTSASSSNTLPIVKSCPYAGQTVTLENALFILYSTVFLEWIVRNPLVPHEILYNKEGERFMAPGIASKLEEFMRLPIFGLSIPA